MADYVVKFPVFNLSPTQRGVLLVAKVLPPGTHAEATLLTDDGKMISMSMEVARLQRAAQHGPYVVLAEVKGARGDDLPGLIVGANGKPL